MTLEEVRAMTPEEKRVKLAVLLGYEHGLRELGDQQFDRWLIPGCDRYGIHNWVSTSDLPDYCNDLNAVHNVEKTLTPHQLKWMEEHMRRVVGKEATDDDWEGPNAATKPWHATALQRTTALILTLSTQR